MGFFCHARSAPSHTIFRMVPESVPPSSPRLASGFWLMTPCLLVASCEMLEAIEGRVNRSSERIGTPTMNASRTNTSESRIVILAYGCSKRFLSGSVFLLSYTGLATKRRKKRPKATTKPPNPDCEPVKMRER